ncbi:MAG: exodeoxyribonuclease VII large subunit [Geobacter sp.]|nr:exodeoxyribonuclease VII large subunit [Geobacter sp.]
MNIFTEQTILTVSRLTGLVKDLLEDNFCQVWVEGELSNLAQPSSGHLYFTLKDSGAMLRCVMFRSSVKVLRFKLNEGMALIVRGRLSVYDQRGEYQLLVEYAEPKGLGALQAAFIQMKERLAGEGLFAAEHKRPLPAIPQRVTVVTSATGAAIHDILNVLGRRHAGVELLLYPVRVQGVEAADEIAAALDDLNRLQAADVIIVGRGGGSLEDLWAFNEEAVARSIFRSVIPVISAVGHETDWTISDFVADLRAPTPSAAAELVTVARKELRESVAALEHRLYQSTRAWLQLRQRYLEGLQRALHDPLQLLGYQAQRLDDLSTRLASGLRNLLTRRREQLARSEQRLGSLHPALQISRFRQQVQNLSEQIQYRTLQQLDYCGRTLGEETARLNALSPLQTMARGFAVVERCKDGMIVRSTAEIEVGSQIRLRLHQGTARCLVEEL